MFKGGPAEWNMAKYAQTDILGFLKLRGKRPSEGASQLISPPITDRSARSIVK
jgi:hypothetical protein